MRSKRKFAGAFKAHAAPTALEECETLAEFAKKFVKSFMSARHSVWNVLAGYGHKAWNGATLCQNSQVGGGMAKNKSKLACDISYIPMKRALYILLLLLALTVASWWHGVCTTLWRLKIVWTYWRRLSQNSSNRRLWTATEAANTPPNCGRNIL